jgi:hypothetical protein
MGNNITSGKEDQLTINKGKLDSINVYEITEDELEKLEKGGSDSLFLNFSIFFFTAGISFLVSLLTTEINSIKLFNIFFIITLVSFIVGLVLFVLWWRYRKPIKNLVNKIRDRIGSDCITTPTEGEAIGRVCSHG